MVRALPANAQQPTGALYGPVSVAQGELLPYYHGYVSRIGSTLSPRVWRFGVRLGWR